MLIIDGVRVFSSPFCRWNSSSSSADVIRLEVGLCLMEAVRGCIGVELAVPLGVCWCTDSAELDLVISSVSSFSAASRTERTLN